MLQNFPKNFYWGASTSAHQIEGELENNWSEWEKIHAIEASRKNKKKRPHDIIDQNYKDACDPNNYISGKACDSYRRYKEDIEVIKELGLNSYRFSIAWSRIEPEKGNFSKKGMQYYKNLVKELRANNIEPFLTCWHWTIPLWLKEEGGLLADNIVEYFKRYVEFLVDNLGDDVKYWITINEPLVVATGGYLIGDWPPQKKDPFSFWKVAYRVLVDMHREAYLAVKDYDKDLQVSVAKHNGYIEAYNKNPSNKILANIYRYYSNFKYLDQVKDYLDYIGLNYYFHNKVGILGLKNEDEPLSDVGWWMDPKSIYYTLTELKDRYDLPIYITENGLADREDKYRHWWLDETVEGMREALEYGADLRGYMHWSLLDNFEWANGYWPRFGLVTRDREVKESGWHYEELIQECRAE
jgi:beta-glucosidase